MSDVYSNTPDQSYFDWLKRTLGANLPSQQTLQDYGFLPKGIATTPITEAKGQVVGPGVVTANADTTGMYGAQNILGLPSGLRLPVQKPDASNLAEYVVNNADPFVAPPDYSKIATRPDIPLNNNNRIADLQTQVMSRPDLPAIRDPNYSSPVPFDPRLALASPQFQSMIAGRPDVPPQFQSMIAGRPDAVGQNVFNTPQVSSLFAAKPDGVGSNTIIAPPPSSQTSTYPTSVNQQINAPAPDTISSSVFGLGSQVDPNAINPQTGLTNAQTQMMQYNMLGSVGAKLLAAGQNIMPAQRAQILSELGSAASEPMTMMAQMQQRLLQNNKLVRENAQQANLAKIMQSAEFQQSFKDMSPQYQSLAQAAAASGDINGVMGLIEKTQPRYVNGMWIDPQKQTMTDPVTQVTYGPNGVVQPTTQTVKNQIEFDPKTYGLPEGTQARPMFTNMPDSSGYKSEMAKVYMGEILPSQGRSGAAGKLTTDTAAAFPDYDPTLARNAYNINQQLTNHKAGNLGAYKDSVGAMAGHFNELVDASKNLNNVSPMVWNSLKNKFETQAGGSAPVEFQNAANIYLSEVAKVLKAGGVPTDSDKSEIANNFNQAMSQGQLRGALLTMDRMARAKIDSTDSSIKGDLQRLYNPDKHGLVNSYAKKQFDQADNNSWLHPEKSQTQSAPVKVGKYKYNPQTGQLEIQ